MDQVEILARTLEAVSAVAFGVTSTAQVCGRIKTSASTARKDRGRQVRSLDGLGLRVIVDDVAECYEVVRRLHMWFDVLSSEYNDYVRHPKANGYRSLHTTILTVERHPLEIQVRTARMHYVAEQGTAAHWLYKLRSND